MATARYNPIPYTGVTPLPYQIGSASNTTLAGGAVFQSHNFYCGGLIDNARFRKADPADVYPVQGWFADAWAYADTPGQMEFYGANAQITLTTYRQVGPAIVAPAGVGTFVQGFRIPCTHFYMLFRNGSSAQGSFNCVFLVRAA